MKAVSPQFLTANDSVVENGADRMKNILDSLLAVVFVLDSKGRFTFANGTVRQVWGYEPGELLGRLCFDIILPEDVEKTRDYILSFAAGHPILHFENRFVHKNGNTVLISWAAAWQDSDRQLYCTARDATERNIIIDKKFEYERELNKRNLGLTEILDRINDGFFVLDREWRIVYGNGQVQNMVNCKLEDVLGKTIWECFPKTAGTAFEVNYRKAVEEQLPVHFEAFYGEPLNIWFSLNVYPSPNGLSVFIRNINEEKQLELEKAAFQKHIDEQNANLTEILEGITDAFYTLDRNWNVTYFNRQAELLSGFKRESAVSRTVWDTFPKVRGTQIESNLRKAMEEQVPVTFEAPSTIRPDMLLEFSINPSQLGLSVFYRDITQRKRVEEEIRKLSHIAKETVNSVVILTPDNKIVWVNEAFTRRTGYSLEEAVGKHPGVLLDGPDTNMSVVHYIREQQKRKQPYHVEILSYTKYGEPYWSDIQAQPFFDEAGNVQQYFSIETDITERKKLEYQLEMERKKITAAVIDTQEKERSQIGRELHDNVNQVLTTVKLYTELCRDGVGNTQEILEKSVKLLQDSIDEIRSISKRLSAPSLGKMRLKDSVQELVDSIMATNKLEVMLECSEIMKVQVSQELHMAVYRILQEHLTNVLRHAGASTVTVRLRARKKFLFLHVSDNGKGFDPLQPSNGIGIRNMKIRTESLQGKLAIKSAPGCGCELSVSLPLTA